MKFVALGASETQASVKAQALLQAFLEVDPTIGGAVDDLIAEVEAEAEFRQAQVDSLQPKLTSAELLLIEQLDLIDMQIAAVSGRLVDLVVIEATLLPALRQNLDLERQFLIEQLDNLRSERDSLGPRPEATVTVEEALLLASLEHRLQLLTSEYDRLFLRRLGVTSVGTVEPVTFTDLTPEPVDPVLSAVVGLVGGLLIAVFGVTALARTRKTVWLPQDIDIPVLGSVPARPFSSDAAEAWYDTAELGPRKTSIQALRSALQAQVPSTGSTIAFTGRNLASEGVQALAADLAGSMASAGDSVFLLDADFGSRSGLFELRVGGSSLADVLRLSPHSMGFEESVSEAVQGAHLIRPGLAVMPSGPPPSSPGDALAGRQFRFLVQAAEARYDATIVAVDDIESPSGQAAMQRLRHGVLVVTPGSVTEPEVSGLLLDAERLKVVILGAVFLSKPDWLMSFIRGRLAKRDVQKASVVTEPTPDVSEAPRLHGHLIPEERHSSVVTHHSLTELVDQLGVSQFGRDDNLGVELLAALNGSSRDRAYEAVAEYVVSRTEDIATAHSGHGDLSEGLIKDVSVDGFISLKPLGDHRTVASWLTQEIEREVDPVIAVELLDEMHRVLSERFSSQPGLDNWLSAEFFRRHIARTHGQPVVWHLTSPAGSVGVLVPARRLNVERFETVLREVASLQIGEFERIRKEAAKLGDQETADEAKGRVDDVRQFEKAVTSLITNGDGDRRPNNGLLWEPDWAVGTRPNLAPLQRAGLLPFDVLTEEEMAAAKLSV